MNTAIQCCLQGHCSSRTRRFNTASPESSRPWTSSIQPSILTIYFSKSRTRCFRNANTTGCHWTRSWASSIYLPSSQHISRPSICLIAEPDGSTVLIESLPQQTMLGDFHPRSILKTYLRKINLLCIDQFVYKHFNLCSYLKATDNIQWKLTCNCEAKKETGQAKCCPVYFLVHLLDV